MIPYEEFLPDIEPFARGCPTPTAINALRNAAIDLCKRTRIWSELLDPALDVTAGSGEVELLLPDQSEAIDVLAVWFKKEPLTPITEDALRHAGIRPGDQGTPRFFNYGDLYVLELAPIPKLTEAAVLDVKVSLHPTIDSDGVPDPLHRKYREVIAAGALARLLRIDDDWARRAAQTARAANIDYAGQFEGQCSFLAHRVSKGNTRTRRRTYNQWF